MVKDSYGSFEIGNRLNNKPHERCIKIDSLSHIDIDYYKDGRMTVGNYLQIYPYDRIVVGDRYDTGNGELRRRFTNYKTDGTTEEYGDHSSQVESVF